MFRRSTLGFAGVLLVGGLAVAALSLRGEPQRRTRFAVMDRPHVAPDELARWIVEGRRDFAIVDLRPAADFAAGHVRGAVSCATCHGDNAEGRKAEESGFVDLSKKLVLYTDSGSEAVELPRLLADNPGIYFLDGGYRAWRAQILGPVSFGGETSEAELLARQRREALRAFFAGERPGAAAPAPLPVTPMRRDGAHKPAGTGEGC